MFQEDSVLISVHTRNRFILSVNSSHFIDNKYLILVSLHCFSDTFDIDPINVKLNMYDTIIRNNLATSVLVEGVQHLLSIPNGNRYIVIVLLKGIVVNDNIVTNTQWVYAISVGNLQSSVLSFSTVDEVILKNSSFSDNQGTPLTVKTNQKETSLSLKGEIHFTNNTGVLGGACGLQNTQVLIHKNTEENIIFEGNNTATASGNSVYFATMPQGVIPNCSFNDIQLTDISTPAFNMKYQGERVFSLIPGQTVYINVSVNDYYGSPSSCTANVYITCNNWPFICSREHIRLNGPDYVVLAQKEVGAYTEVDTKLNISAPQMLGDTTVRMLLMCPNAELSIMLNISTTCPLGFAYNTSEGVCKCANITTNHGTVICSENLGIACIIYTRLLVWSIYH